MDRPRLEPEAPPAPDPPEPDVLRQHDVRDLVARGYDPEQLAQMVVGYGAARHATAIVNVVEVVAPAGKQLEIERLIETRRSGLKGILQFYDVKDLCGAAAAEVVPPDGARSTPSGTEVGLDEGMPPTTAEKAPPGADPASLIDIDYLIEVIKVTIGPGEIQQKNHVLVVRAQPVIHAAIARFLADLRSTVETAGTKDP